MNSTMAMSLGSNGLVPSIEQADADANIQRAISLLHPFLVKMVLSNPITSKKMRSNKPDFSQSLEAIIDDWNLFYPTGSPFSACQEHFVRAKWVRNFVAHQSFDCSNYHHFMESLAKVATAIGEPDLNKKILKSIVIEKVNVTNVNEDDWTSLKQEGDQLYKEERFTEAMNYFTRAIHLNQEEAELYSNRALCELRLSKFDLAREDIEDAIQLDPKNVKYYRVLSEVLLQMKMHEESLAACMQGLKINPRDEVLNVRERDCRALIVSDFTDKNPLFFKSWLGGSTTEKKEQTEKMVRRYKNLPLTSEDIEDCPNLDKYSERFQIMMSITKAHQYENWGLTACTQSSKRKAFEIFEAAAKKGSAEGLFNVATYYSEAKAGFVRDFPKAMELCRKAASQKAFFRFNERLFPNVGVSEAENFLGNCYRDGRGVDTSSTEAFKWYLRGSRHDCPASQNNLARALLNGDGCRKDETSARRWFQMAAEFGLAEAQCNYAIMLENGIGGPIDAKKAGELFQLSANQGFLGAMTRLQELSRSGALGASAIERNKENLEKMAKNGDPACLYLLGHNYLNGSGGFNKDLRQAERYLREASKAGYAEAHLPLGKLLLELKKNEEAFEFIKLSAEKGSAEGQFELGTLFAYGHGCARNEASARRWLNRAKQHGLSLRPHSPDEDDESSKDWVEIEIDSGWATVEFETRKLLKSEGMSINERKRRFIISKLQDANNPVASTYLEYLNAFSPAGGPARGTWLTPYFRDKLISPECMNELISRAQNGSVTAQSFFKACEIVKQAIDLLKRKQNIVNDVFELFRLSLREWDLIILLYSNFYLECVEAAKEALDRNPENADALYVLVRMDTTQSNVEKLEMAKRCVTLNPSVPDFHHLLSCMWGFVDDININGLMAIERAIELLPNHPDWLYERATRLRLIEEEEGKKRKKYDFADVADAYLKFISSNPIDHRKRPEAFYCLAYIYALSNEKTKAERYFQKGLEAEDPKIRLPCFELVKDDFPPKMFARIMLNALELGKEIPLENTTDAANTALKKSTNNCANCFKINRSLRCSACKSVWYCDRVCQDANWKKHKVDCKRLCAQN